MEPPVALAASVVVVAGLPLLAAGADAAGRVIAKLRIPLVPKPLIGLAAIVLATLRPGPAEATTPPPILRIDQTERAPADGAPAREMPLRASSGAHVVKPGDTLWGIACMLLASADGSEPTSAAVDTLWPRIYEANRHVIGDDPGLIFPGQRLVLPNIQEA